MSNVERPSFGGRLGVLSARFGLRIQTVDSGRPAGRPTGRATIHTALGRQPTGCLPMGCWTTVSRQQYRMHMASPSRTRRTSARTSI